MGGMETVIPHREPDVLVRRMRLSPDQADKLRNLARAQRVSEEELLAKSLDLLLAAYDVLEPAAKPAPTRWLSMAGVGAEMWRALDSDAYLDQERDAWR